MAQFGLMLPSPSLPDARPRSDRPRCGGRESEFLADGFLEILIALIESNSGYAAKTSTL